MHGESPIKRRESRKIWVGNVPVGGDAPIAVQSMTNTDTNDVAATVAQIQRLVDAGVDIVRVSVPDMDAAEAFGKIKQRVSVPLVADIHFDYKIALRVAELGVDCLRINPGNIGREDRVRAVVDAARDRGIPIRIGVNAGSLEKDLQKKYGEPTPAALVESILPRKMRSFMFATLAMVVPSLKVLARITELPTLTGISRIIPEMVERIRVEEALALLLETPSRTTSSASRAATFSSFACCNDCFTLSNSSALTSCFL